MKRDYIINGNDLVVNTQPLDDLGVVENVDNIIKTLVADHNALEAENKELKALAYCDLGMSYKSRVEDLQHSCNSSSTRYWALVHKITDYDLEFVSVMKAKEWIVDNMVSVAPAKDNKIHSYTDSLQCDDETFRFFGKMTHWHDSDELPEEEYDCIIKLEDGYTVGSYSRYFEDEGRWIFDIGIDPDCKFKWRRI